MMRSGYLGFDLDLESTHSVASSCLNDSGRKDLPVGITDCPSIRLFCPHPLRLVAPSKVAVAQSYLAARCCCFAAAVIIVIVIVIVLVVVVVQLLLLLMVVAVVVVVAQ